jgi:tyrosyl-tRNA synthetase
VDEISKAKLIERSSWQETVPKDGLNDLFKQNPNPKHYVGIEISGFLHLGSLLSTGYKINDFVEAGAKCTVFLADWHTFINDKLGADWETISKVSKYYVKAFKEVCPDADIVLGSDLIENHKEYWPDFIKFTKHASLKRVQRTLTIMGRTENEEKTDLAKLLYPPMQAVDIHHLDVDIAHAGMDQRKIHMLVRDVFPKLGWKVPVSVHHKILPSLSQARTQLTDEIVDDKPTKMSKSDPNSGIFINDSDEMITKKINKSWCELGKLYDSPLVDIVESIILPKLKKLQIEIRDGNHMLTFDNFQEFLDELHKEKIHPADFKTAVVDSLIEIISPLREKLKLDEELENLIRRSV